MSKRLRAALFTLRNPIMMVIGLFYVGSVVIGVIKIGEPPSLQSCYPKVQAGYDFSLSVPILTQLYHSEGRDAVLERFADVESLRLDSSWFRDDAVMGAQGTRQVKLMDAIPGGLASVLPDCPKLRRIVADHAMLRAEDLKAIGRITQLQELSLAHCDFGTRPKRPPVLALLKGLENLKVLDLTGFKLHSYTDEEREKMKIPDGDYPKWSLHEEVHHLAELPGLRTLCLFHSSSVDSRMIQALAALPQVETLALDMLIVPYKELGHVSAGDIEHLRAMPNLQTLYVPTTRPFQDPVTTCRATLPGVAVRRGSYDERRVGKAQLMLIGLMALLFGAVQQSVCTSLCSLAPVAPRFRNSHLKATGIVFGVAILTSTLILVAHRAAFVPAIAMCLGFVATCTFIFEGQTPSKNDERTHWHEYVCAVLMGPSIFIVFLSGMVIPEWYDSWLAGDYLVTAWLVIIASVLVFRRIPSAVSNAVNRAHESGVGSAASMTDFLHLQRDRVRRRQQHALEHGRSPLLNMSGKLEETLNDLPVDRQSRMRTLLRAGSELGPFVLLRFSLLMLLFVIGIVILPDAVKFLQGQSWPQELDASRLLMAMTFMLVIGPVGIVTAWRNRMSQRLGTELLRPVTRTCLRRLLFQSVALDMLPLFTLVAIANGVLALIMSTPETGLIIVAVIISAAVLEYGIGMWVIMIRRTWVAILLAIALFGLWQTTMVTLLMNNWEPSLPALIPIGSALIVGVVATGLAWRHWLRREMS